MSYNLEDPSDVRDFADSIAERERDPFPLRVPGPVRINGAIPLPPSTLEEPARRAACDEEAALLDAESRFDSEGAGQQHNWSHLADTWGWNYDGYGG